MSTWSTLRLRALILAEHSDGAHVSALARRYGYSRSGIYRILARAKREERLRAERKVAPRRRSWGILRLGAAK